jgi:hypothetical protein
MTVAVSGAAEPEAVRRLAEKYFGGWAPLDASTAVALAPSVAALDAEPSARPGGSSGATGSWTATSSSSTSSSSGPPQPLDYATSSRAGPLVLSGYYRPSLLASTGAGVALEVACDVLAAGRTGRLNRVTQAGRLLAVGVTPDFPAELHAGMALVTARPRAGEGGGWGGGIGGVIGRAST